MAKEFAPAGFDKAAILAGLHTALGFGAPTRVEDRATFYMPVTESTLPPIGHAVSINTWSGTAVGVTP